MAEASLKDQGNEEFKKGNWMKAAVLYTKGIKEDPENAVLYSNRCAALLKMSKVSKALADAEQCIKLRPDWDKGYFRKGSVHETMEQYKEALEAFQQAQQKNPANPEVTLKIRTLHKFIKSLDKQPGGTADTAAARDDESPSAAPTESKTEATPAPTSQPPATQKQTSSSGAQSSTTAKPAPKSTGSSQSGGLKALTGPIAEFMEQWLTDAVAGIHDGSISPSIHFLPGKYSELPQDSPEANIRASNAFDSPTVFQEFCNFLAGMRAKLDAIALCAILPKSSVSFPEVWRKSGWPCGNADGVFFQLMSKEARSVVFIPVEGGTARPPVELDLDFGILPWLLVH